MDEHHDNDRYTDLGHRNINENVKRENEMPSNVTLEMALKIALIDGLGNTSKRQLINHFGIQSLSQFNLSQLQDAYCQLLNNKNATNLSSNWSSNWSSNLSMSKTDKNWREIKIADEVAVEKYMKICRQYEIQCIVYGQQNYPKLLSEIHSPPLILYVCGNSELLLQPQLAIVGSRHASVNGASLAFDFASQLALNGFVITSGMALGIDGQAHSGALSVGARTIAVLGTGVDIVYPKRHQKLYEQIKQNGAIISEFLPGTGVRKEYFPQRNRIIAGLSLGTIVVEAGLRSGSLITARMAADSGREVFAMPGSVHSALSKGCHQLLRQGAILVEEVADIYNEIQQYFMFSKEKGLQKAQKDRNPIANGLNGVAKQVYELIDYDLTDLDKLINFSGLSLDELMPILLQLELSGLILEVSGRYQKVS